MALAYPRRVFLNVCGTTLILGTAGCVGDSSTDNTQGKSNASDKTTQLDFATTERTTIAPSSVSNKEAKEHALAAERNHLTNLFKNASCVEEWGLSSYTGLEKEAVVSSRTDTGIYVDVTYPYWYSTTEEDVDSGSETRYLVTTEGTQRIDSNDFSPC